MVVERKILSDRLADRVIVITGACGGIGAGIAAALMSEDAKVALWDLNLDHTIATANKLDPTGERAAGFAADVTDDSAVRAATAATVSHFGRLDGLVNALIITMGEAWHASPKLWDTQLRVNATGSFDCAKAVGEHLRDNGGGGSVNVSSNCGKAGYRTMAAYNADKAAVINLTRSLSMEWAEHSISIDGGDTPTDHRLQLAIFNHELKEHHAEPLERHCRRRPEQRSRGVRVRFAPARFRTVTRFARGWQHIGQGIDAGSCGRRLRRALGEGLRMGPCHDRARRFRASSA